MKTLTGLGFAASGLAGGLRRLIAQEAAISRQLRGACWLTPELTEGPYYFDPDLLRQDITEGLPGMPFNLGIYVMDINCNPVPNLLVDVWHASKDGLYSGYAQPGGNTVGQTFLRGTYPTDASGTAVFQSIYPGWYQGRATHVHFKVRIPDQTYVTSQFAFDDAINDLVYATDLYIDRGPNPTTNAQDNIFGTAHPEYLEVELEENVFGGYDGVFVIGVAADLSLFIDGFEAGDLSAWSTTFPA